MLPHVEELGRVADRLDAGPALFLVLGATLASLSGWPIGRTRLALTDWARTFRGIGPDGGGYAELARLARDARELLILSAQGLPLELDFLQLLSEVAVRASKATP